MDLIAYIRVSKVGGREGDSFQSPKQQRQAIDAIVSLTPGARIVDEIEDLDESGGTMDRPGVKRAIEMVESGQADGIVCAYLDRWARHIGALEMVERWANEGKAFITAREKFDTTNAMGRFALRMMMLVAQLYREQAIERWDDTVRNAVERGVHVTVPYGYRRANGNGKAHAKGGTRGAPLVIEPSEAAIVRRIFGERLSGHGAAAIADGLNRDGVPSPRGGLWTRQAVRALIRVRAYAGVAHRGDHETPDAHPAIIPPNEWEAAQRERGPARQNGKSILGGMVRCAGCGYVMGASSSSHGGRRYNCNRHHAELRCQSPTTAPADALEQFVTDEFLARYGQGRVRGADATDPAVAETETALDRVRTEYAAWRDDAELRSAIGDADYRAGLIARKAVVSDAERAYGDAVRQSKTDALTVEPGAWKSLDVAERRELLHAGIDAIVARRAASTHTPLSDRVEIVWAGELNHDGTPRGIAAAVRGRP